MDVLLALFILYILIFIVGMIRKGLLWSFLQIFVVLVMFYEGAGIVLVFVMLFISVFSLIYNLKGEDQLE